VRREMLFFSRTPERMAEVLGAFADRAGSPDAAERFYDDLEGVTAADVLEVLGGLLDRDSASAEVPPQPLRR
jgi:predicted Zn-dependent peptidase